MRRDPSPAFPILLLAALWAASCGTPDVPTPPSQPSAALPVVTLQVRGHRLRAHVAATPEARDRGLMERRELGEDEGMLFVFPEAGYHSFWMQNTPLPLSVAFLENDGRIVSIARMAPHDPTDHVSPRPVRYVLETRQGWFRDRRLVPGDRCRFTLPAGLRPR